MKDNRKTMFFLSAVMLINALSYGTIIPLFYPYAQKFGLETMGLSLLFASFSAAQFIATPVIGRLSDVYGRRPLLLISLFGTAISLALFASAQAVWMLFVARILDGITGGNISVAQAVISDSVPAKKRSQAYGLLGASFGVGFLVGPAFGGLLSQYDITTPFWLASFLALLATVVGFFILPETLRKNNLVEQQISNNPKEIFLKMKKSGVALVLLASFLVSISFNAFVISFQSFTNVALGLSSKEIGLLFSLVGLMSIIMQGFGVAWLQKIFHRRSLLIFIAELSTALILLLLGMPFSENIAIFIVFLILYQIVNAPLGPLITAIITEKTEINNQGEVLGINQSLVSIAQIIGPILAGLIISKYDGLGFVLASVLMFFGFLASYRGYWLSKNPSSI